MAKKRLREEDVELSPVEQKKQLELELKALEQKKKDFRDGAQKSQSMATNAKKLSSIPSGLTDRAKSFDLRMNNDMNQKNTEEAKYNREEMKKVDAQIQDIKNKMANLKNPMGGLTKEDIRRMVENEQPPIMTKRELIESIANQLLTEDMHRDIKNKIDSGNNDYSEHLDPETVKRISNEIMNDIKANVEARGGRANFEGAQRLVAQGLTGAIQKEARNKPQLERLAVKLVCEEYNIPEGVVDFEASITGHPDLGGREIQKTGLKMRKGNKRPPQGKRAEDLKPNVTKRRLMNAMMHGAARKGQNLFHMATEELNRINPSLVQDYTKLMAGNDFMYWALDDQTIAQESESGTHAGQVRVYIHGNPPQEGGKPKIVAEGMTFPMLLHELTKGVLELISQWGREADKETRDYVEDQTDNLEAEPWDVRLGSRIWEKLLEAVDIDALPYKSQIFTRLSSLPPAEFNAIVRGLMNDNERAKDRINDIVHDIVREANSEELENATSKFREPEGNDDDSDVATPESEDQGEDEELQRLLGNKKEEPEVDDPRTWSKRELENARDEAIDDEDWKAVGYYQNLLDNKR